MSVGRSGSARKLCCGWVAGTRRQNAGLLVTPAAAASAGEERSRHISPCGEGLARPHLESGDAGGRWQWMKAVRNLAKDVGDVTVELGVRDDALSELLVDPTDVIAKIEGGDPRGSIAPQIPGSP